MGPKFQCTPFSPRQHFLFSYSENLDFEGFEADFRDFLGIFSEDCGSDPGPFLVGAGIWTGEQLNLVGTGSVDMCAFNGVQLGL